MNKQYYKVCNVGEYGLESAYNKYYPHPYYPCPSIGIKYKLNKWASPNRGRNPFLFVFDNREYARDFKRKGYKIGHNFRIFKCEVKNPGRTKRDVNGKLRTLGYDLDCVMGSVIVDKVKLTKQI